MCHPHAPQHREGVGSIHPYDAKPRRESKEGMPPRSPVCVEASSKHAAPQGSRLLSCTVCAALRTMQTLRCDASRDKQVRSGELEGNVYRWQLTWIEPALRQELTRQLPQQPSIWFEWSPDAMSMRCVVACMQGLRVVAKHRCRRSCLEQRGPRTLCGGPPLKRALLF